MAKDNTFSITFKDFHTGQAPLAHLDDLSEIGQSGQYNSAENIDIISKPGKLTQGPGLTVLTNGTQAAAVTDLINHILDIPVASDVTYGVSATKLHKITPTTVINTGDFPHTITSATDGESSIELGGALYYFFNKSSGGDIGKYDLSSSFTDSWGSTVPTGAAALQKAPHPVAKKQDLMVFGNGRYAGVYNATTNILDVDKLDFGANSEVADVCFHANQWWIAVNYGITTGTNRTSSQVYTYDGAAISAILSDEVAVGTQRIGYILPKNGVIEVAYQDVSGSCAIGYIAGRALKPLRYFTGTLPNFAQKTLYKNTTLFVKGSEILSCGAPIEQLPIQLSHHATASYSTIGALAAPFGTPMVASTQSTSYNLAKFANYSVASTWRSILIPLMRGRHLGYIDEIVIITSVLGSGARCDLNIRYNQNTADTDGVVTLSVTGTNKRRFVFTKLGLPANGIEDFILQLSWESGSTSNPAEIRQIQVNGHYIEK